MLRQSGVRSFALSAVAALTFATCNSATAQTASRQSHAPPANQSGAYERHSKGVSIDSPTQGNASGETYQLMRPSLERPSLPTPPEISTPSLGSALGSSAGDASAMIDQQREALFEELAEEFNAFDRLGRLVRKVSHLVKPSVIHIEAHKTETNNGKYESYDEAGSGVVVAISGGLWILTNRHVIQGARPNEIMLRSSDGRQFRPAQIYTDEGTDVAVMQVTNMDLPAAHVGDSESVGIGDFTIAIGSPFGLSHSVTFGILSAKGRRDLSLGDKKIDLQDFFQTDAAINPGNSGGPLLNLRGEVIGLNTAIASSSGGSEGIGFAIPINMAMRVADELVRYGRYRRGYLGVVLDPDFGPQDLGAAALLRGGALVKTVHRGSPAAKANLQRGDIIVQFNGTNVENDDHLVAQVGMTPIGSHIPMVIHRDGKNYRAEVELTDLN
ncbi:S1C family serine protease [Rhodopirellula sp. MGV]|uniref:S1C family serine protease n=1 Tax=Rhodopirellula sp. MGV TaxID=2023130 RepID=UPI0039656C70